MKKIKIFQLFLLASMLCLIGCKKNETQQENSSFVIKGDSVFVKNNDAVFSQIKLSEVETVPYSKEVITAGTVQPLPTQFAYIAPPFAGRVVKSYIKLGQKVKANTPLFEIVSPDFTNTQKEFFQAKSEKELAQKELQRKQDLLSNGVGSQKEMEEAASILQIAEKEYENTYAALQVYHVNAENMALGQPLIIRSPIAGEVIENNVITGQYIKDDSDPIAIVADLSEVWISAQVKEKDIRFIHENDEMDIFIAAYPEKTLKGKVFHVEEAVDDDTRAIKVLSFVDNKDGLLKIGMYTTVHFLDKPADFIQIPETALLQGEKNSYVFVQKSPDIFIKTPVEVEATMDGTAIISKGLSKNDVIISEGGYYLK
ncbi:putative membrane fusion protein SilB [Teleopsis dalmanni]|uniref:putative membrane fusion protein SilB n=1 Tax=Teleopsis dalmanni TaxID=139649 RepID=UPI0018CE3F24|nr:putative membrane fusion protein SilB [Teleopsis dalmanni]